MSNFKHECSDSTPIAKRSDSRWQPQPGQQLAVIAGEGQGWMAQVIATQVGPIVGERAGRTGREA